MTAEDRVVGQINDLTQSLEGYGTPKVTPTAEVCGALQALQKTIDEFLPKPGSEIGYDTGRGAFNESGGTT